MIEKLTERERALVEMCKLHVDKQHEDFADPRYDKKGPIVRGYNLGQAMMALDVLEILGVREHVISKDKAVH